MEESPKTTRVQNPRDEQRKDDREALNCGFSDDGNLDNLTSRNNNVWGGDTMILTYGKISNTGNTDSTIGKRTSKRGKESLNLPSIGALGVTINAAKAGGRTGTTDQNDDRN